jgi:hypothetical protein
MMTLMCLLVESRDAGGRILEAQEIQVSRVRGREAQRLVDLHGDPRGGIGVSGGW